MPNFEKATRPVVFLGGIFTPGQTDFVMAESKGVIQNAADALQKSLIRGIAENINDVAVVNLPFIGSYPRGFKLISFPGTDEIILSNIRVLGCSFIVIRLVKSFSRTISAFRGLLRIDRRRKAAIIIYSAHLPFVVAALMYCAIFRNSRTCLILPDFPEFMGEGSRLYRMAKAAESYIFYRLASRVDSFVLLTRFMADRLGLEEGRYVVVEGIADIAIAASTTPITQAQLDANRRIFLYTGTLALRYGVMDLVNAFKRVSRPDVELWLCGEGDGRERILSAMTEDPRIRFFGQVSRDEARRLQAMASILVNPRSPTGEYTKYSFPSKTMEYMASGRPVLMYRLSGMPDDYLPYFVQPQSVGVEGLAVAIEELAGWSADRLALFGAAAQAFVLNEKNPTTQCRKIVSLLSSIA